MTNFAIAQVVNFIPSAEAPVWKDGKKTGEVELHAVLNATELQRDRYGSLLPATLTIKVVIAGPGKAADPEKKQALLDSIKGLKPGQFLAIQYADIGTGKDRKRWYQKVSVLEISQAPQLGTAEITKAIEQDPAVNAAQIAALAKISNTKLK